MPQDLSGQQVGMAPANNVNNPKAGVIKGRNQFPMTHKHLTTQRYGEYDPFFCIKCERGDVIPFTSLHDLHTYTLSSPMLADVNMTKSYIKVPMQAIYPRNWDIMMPIPTHGDDVPEDTRFVVDVQYLIQNLVYAIEAFRDDFSNNNDTRSLAMYFRAWFLLESVCSAGSLFTKFNIHTNVCEFRCEYSTDDVVIGSIDKHIDYLLSYLREGLSRYAWIDGQDRYLYIAPANSDDMVTGRIYITYRRWIELMRRGELSPEDSFEGSGVIDIPINFTLVKGLGTDDNGRAPLNLEPILAYQLSCAQFGTNDRVDFVYSAQLYRDNMESLLYAATRIVDRYTFDWNGLNKMYDVFSGHCFSSLLSTFEIGLDDLVDGSDVYAKLESALDFLTNLLMHQPSLRYGDYFTGGKPEPLAVGEYSAEVTDNSVSAIDITKSIQMQRLLNNVNLVGRKLGDYLAGIFGGRLPDAPKDVPVFLAHQKFDITGFQTENTGERQFDPNEPNAITTNLRSQQSKHAFEIEIAEPCYVIAMSSFDCLRVYSRTLDRMALHFDRYDDFIPQMQYIGDQEIYRNELDISAKYDLPFAYALRYMEYKQRYSYASGGFIENLPSWAFITDNADGNPPVNNIDPDYIRSSPSEFDRFYKSLTGYSLGSYFHFIIAYTNIVAPIRQMEYAPEILK